MAYTLIGLLSVLAFTTDPTQASKCCLPTQMEGLVGLSQGYQVKNKGFGVEALFKFAFDVKGKRQSMLGEGRTNGIPFKEHVIEDHAAGKKYTVVNGKCTIEALTNEMLYCIPSDAKLLMSTYYGFGDKKIDVDMYSFSYGELHVTMAVTKDSCVPVSEHIATPNGFIDLGFMGMASGIQNTTVFDIPKPCQKVEFMENFSQEQNSLEHLRHKRHTPLIL